jgi:uncharacterized membrane protein YhaH (DUF805 family)
LALPPSTPNGRRVARRSFWFASTTSLLLLAVSLLATGFELTSMSSGRQILLIAMWCPAAHFLFCYLSARRLRSLGYQVCPHCGYHLAGLASTGRCPECGGDYDVEEIRRDWGG